MTREAIRRLGDRVHDALVVGGGLMGVGIARDLARRGFAVALVEQHDLASGTTSRPTRLIHGGLRYLELMDFGLVRADMREREVLLAIAPHLVRPLAFLLPIYEENFVRRHKIRLGMDLYDALSFDKSLPRRKWLSRAEVIRLEPAIERHGLRGAWRFYDAQVAFVERLVVENALDAAAHGAVIMTHARAERLLREGDAVVGAVVRDAIAGTEQDVRARIVVNATGPWLDVVGRELRDGKRPLLRLTKGVHVVTPAATSFAHVLFARSDGRLFFVVPWAGRSLIGTTDTDYVGDPADAAASDEDVRYLLSEAHRAFPAAPFDRIQYTYAGVRALAREEGVKEGDVSRKHTIHDHERDGVPGIISVVGGKLTGYRHIAAQASDAASEKLGRRTRARTAAPLPGAADTAAIVASLAERAHAQGLAAGSLEHLAYLYGSLASSVLDVIDDDGGLARPLCRHAPDVAAQLVRAARDEWAVTLADALLRRTAIGLAPCQGLDALDTAASVMGACLGWSARDRDAQIAAYRAEIAPMRVHSTEVA